MFLMGGAAFGCLEPRVMDILHHLALGCQGFHYGFKLIKIFKTPNITIMNQNTSPQKINDAGGINDTEEEEKM